MANPLQKWKKPFFLSKNAVLGFGPKIQKLTPLYYTEKIWIFKICRQIVKTLPDGALRMAKWHFLGTFWPKMWWGPSLNSVSFPIFNGDEQSQIWLAFCHFGLFWPFFGLFWLIFLLLWFGPKNRNKHHFFILKKAKFSESAVRLPIPYQKEPSGKENCIFWPFLGKNGSFYNRAPL